MIAVVDYGAGNLFSVVNALRFIGAKCVITSSAEELLRAEKLILPGVGAFPDAMRRLRETGLVEVIKSEAQKKPLLGICLGMQMLFEESFELGETAGLGLIPGRVSFMQEAREQGLSIPHIGWNSLKKHEECAISFGEDHVYFVHSYAAHCPPENVAAYAEYGGMVPAVVFGRDNFAVGCQFHPEKSGEAGLRILESFINL